jgi:predicted DCC family thiol-disulfide oxidoreductase YuxK
MVIVDIKEKLPTVIYDNQCYLCVKFAKMVEFLSRGNLTIIGHYSDSGIKLRKMLGESALEMFWLIDKKTAYGGRAALLPLLKAIITTKQVRSNKIKVDVQCKQDCKTVKAVFIRSASLFSNSKKIDL